jgi:hypothetical protein
MGSQVRELKTRIKQLERQNQQLHNDLQVERLGRVSAQRGLVAYMEEHELGHRIGYDPDKDEAVLAEIAAGRIPVLKDV